LIGLVVGSAVLLQLFCALRRRIAVKRVVIFAGTLVDRQKCIWIRLVA
jgi:hypothetical protein